jgi:NAD(P)-dependent dehydrogenase (short-subunit alcohol dehydrogenase family)
LGRMGNPESDIGRAVVYLAGNDASYITGTTLMLDGGFNYLR